MSQLFKLALAATASLMMAGSTFAAEPIEGTWKRDGGTIVKFSKCGGSYCTAVQNGEYKGKSIGKMSGAGKSYKGSLTDLAANKTYKGKASISGNTMKLSGCVLGGLICKGETWKRQ